MAFSSSLLSASIPMVAPVAKDAPFSMAAYGPRVSPASKVAPATRVSPVARLIHPKIMRAACTPSSSDLILPLSRSDFPIHFFWGGATSAYQIEGGIDTRGHSAWDYFTGKYLEKIKDRSTGDIASNSYNLYMQDIDVMNEMGLNAYRFSISWSRILPTGKLSDGVNPDGIKYYNDLIDALMKNGKTPFVTLLHVDRPQPLEDEYGGFLDTRMIDDFKDFVDICFKNFGDRVKHWITLNEAYTYTYLGYAMGMLAPARCVGGDSAKEPYIVGHNLLLAHAAAVDLYNTQYRPTQNGIIGQSLITTWYVPYSDAKEDQDAASRAMDFSVGWFMEPLKTGDYPESMRKLMGDRLPTFTDEQKKKLIGSYDFIGVNYYTSQFAADKPVITTPPSAVTDVHADLTYIRGGVAIGENTASGIYVYPRGLRDMLVYMKNCYNNPLIYVTENGMADYNDPSLTVEEVCMDISRIDYYYRHLYYVHSAIKDHAVNVKGYFAWSSLDKFE